ncbi:hypothetical protein, partial [Halioglobus japonicus]|uniref:hypothetical protein n=1 Tax=Halioglobus japonicus TaxID=930805 RepID=UPI001CA5E0D2
CSRHGLVPYGKTNDTILTVSWQEAKVACDQGRRNYQIHSRDATLLSRLLSFDWQLLEWWLHTFE